MLNQLKELPHSTECEQMLLGALLIDNEVYDDISTMLIPEMFYNQLHQQIYSKIIANLNNKMAIDAVILVNSFTLEEQKNDNNYLGTYVNALVDACVSTTYMAQYAKVIQDRYKLRLIVSRCRDTITSALDNETSSEEIITNILNKMIELQSSYSSSIPISYASDVLDNIYALANGKIEYIATNDILLDKNLEGGFNRGELVILAGRPGMGKTSTAINMFVNMSKIHKVIFFTLEMSTKELVKKLYSNYTSSNIKDGLSDQSLLDIADNLRLAKSLALVHCPRLTIEKIKQYIVEYKLKHQTIDVIFIDYLQLLQRPPKLNEVEALSYLTRELKLLTHELNIVIICLSQLNRGNAERRDKRPLMADLKGSGSIEQDTDYVIFLHREAYYLREQGKPVPFELEGIMEFICAKARSKPPFHLLYDCNLAHSKLNRIDGFKANKYTAFLNETSK